MPNREIFNTTKTESSIRAAVLTSTTNGSTVDLKDAEAVNVILDVGQSGDTLSGSVYWTITAQESSDNSSWSTITDSDKLLIAVAGTIQSAATSVVIDDAAEDSTTVEVSYKAPGGERYFRIVVTATGTHSNGTPMSASAVKGYLKVSPESGKANA